MFFALVYYPNIEIEEFHILRKKYEPYASLLPEHVPFIFPVPDSIGLKKLIKHIEHVLSSWKPFEVHFNGLQKSWDHWLFLVLKEGNHLVIKLHDELYNGILSPFYRKDLPYIPHIGLGLFCKEKYDVNNPSKKLSLDEKAYNHARMEFDNLNLNFWRKIDKLTLVKLNSGFSKCENIMEFKIP